MTGNEIIRRRMADFEMKDTAFGKLLRCTNPSTASKWRTDKNPPNGQALLLCMFTERQLREANDKLERMLRK